MDGLPNTVVSCDGCGEDLNILRPYLSVTVKAQRNVVQAMNDDPFEADSGSDGVTVTLGTQSGRGRMLKLHNFKCLTAYTTDDARKNATAKIMPHEEDEIYVPDDNRSPEELVVSGEMSPEVAAAIDTSSAEESDD